MFSVADAAGGNERGRLSPSPRPPGLGAAWGHPRVAQGTGLTPQTDTDPMAKDWWLWGWGITCVAQRSGWQHPRPWRYPWVTPQLGAAAFLVSKCPCVPSASLGRVLAPSALRGGKRGMEQVMIQLSREQDERVLVCSDPGSLQRRVTGQPRVSPASPGCHGEPHHIGTPWGRVTSWRGCPQSLCGSRGTGVALAQVSLGVCRRLWHGGKGREGKEGADRKSVV